MSINQDKMFNPNDHLTQLKNGQGTQDYLPVQWRLVWFRENFPHGTIDTQEMEIDLNRECEAETWVWDPNARKKVKTMRKALGYARFKAVVTDGKGAEGPVQSPKMRPILPTISKRPKPGPLAGPWLASAMVRNLHPN
jgi:hypothetical protein